MMRPFVQGCVRGFSCTCFYDEVLEHSLWVEGELDGTKTRLQ